MNKFKNTIEFWCEVAELTLDFTSLLTLSLSLIPTVRKDSGKKKKKKDPHQYSKQDGELE